MLGLLARACREAVSGVFVSWFVSALLGSWGSGILISMLVRARHVPLFLVALFTVSLSKSKLPRAARPHTTYLKPYNKTRGPQRSHRYITPFRSNNPGLVALCLSLAVAEPGRHFGFPCDSKSADVVLSFDAMSS